MAPLPVSGPALRLGHRLRMRLGGSFEPLADLLGLRPRTLAHVQAWSGPTAAAMLLLGETPVADVPARVRALLHAHGRTSSTAANLIETDLAQASPGVTFGKALDEPIEWVYWATSERASEGETLRLAREEGVVCRPLLESEGEIHAYLFAIRPGDQLLLAYDDEPRAWFEIATVDGKDGPPEGLSSRSHPTMEGSESFDFSTLLPPVFRFVPLASPLGGRLARGEHPYRLFDDHPVGRRQSGWFSALAVRDIQGKRELGLSLERGRGHRSRMTRLRLKSVVSKT